MEDRPKFQTRADRILLNAKAINRVRHDEQENRRSGRVCTASRRLLDDFVTTLPTKPLQTCHQSTIRVTAPTLQLQKKPFCGKAGKAGLQTRGHASASTGTAETGSATVLDSGVHLCQQPTQVPPETPSATEQGISVHLNPQSTHETKTARATELETPDAQSTQATETPSATEQGISVHPNPQSTHETKTARATELETNVLPDTASNAQQETYVHMCLQPTQQTTETASTLKLGQIQDNGLHQYSQLTDVTGISDLSINPLQLSSTSFNFSDFSWPQSADLSSVMSAMQSVDPLSHCTNLSSVTDAWPLPISMSTITTFAQSGDLWSKPINASAITSTNPTVWSHHTDMPPMTNPSWLQPVDLPSSERQSPVVQGNLCHFMDALVSADLEGSFRFSDFSANLTSTPMPGEELNVSATNTDSIMTTTVMTQKVSKPGNKTQSQRRPIKTTKTVKHVKSCRKPKKNSMKQTASVSPSTIIRDIPSGSEDSALSSSDGEEQTEAGTATRTRLRGSVTKAASVQVQEPVMTKTGKKERKFLYKWKGSKLRISDDAVTFHGEQNSMTENQETLHYPIDFFLYYFTDDLMQMIAEQSALYSMQQKPEKPSRITTTEIKKFIGISLYMSLVKLSYTRNYWSRDFRIDQIANTLTLNQFEDIKRFLHFSDNAAHAVDDKLKKIRPIVEHLRNRYKTVNMEEHVSVDEQMVPFKGRSCLRQYNPRKPHKWGYKVWVLCGVSGYAYDFEVYTGKVDNCLIESETDCGASGNVVVRLARSIPSGLNHKLFFDNYFTSPELQIQLARRGIQSVGTVRSNRIPQCTLRSEAVLKQMGRGSIDEKTALVDGIKISAVRWYDNKAVTLLSTYAGSDPVSEVVRWNRKTKSYEKVKCPRIVSIYNKHMGGVDLIDSLIGLYRIRIRSRKWYHRLFFHLLDMTTINAWLLYRRCLPTMSSGQAQSKPMSLHAFKTRIAIALCASTDTVRRGRPAITGAVSEPNRAHKRQSVNQALSDASSKKRKPNTPLPCPELRYDGMHHYPKCVSQRQRCKRETCSGQTRVVCKKCNVPLCLTSKRDCWEPYHTE